MEKIYTVSELNRYIKKRLEGDSELRNVQVTGEISNFKRQQPSGHCYFSLKDKDGVLKCVMFKFKAMGLRFNPRDGETVTAIGHISVYEASGAYQLYVDMMLPKGQGDLMLQYEQLKQKLMREGLFAPERKPLLPAHVQAVGVVTSPTGAVIRDIIKVSRRRNSAVKIYLFPVKVQGKGASAEIARAIRFFNRCGLVDALIVGRGGGSMEDLWAFNEEPTVRAVANSRLPIISAVGHETDVTLCDFAATKRAATPSEAAEMAVADTSKYARQVQELQKRAELAIKGKLKQFEYRMERSIYSPVMTQPERLYSIKEAKLQNLLASRCLQRPRAMYEDKAERLARLLAAKVLQEPQCLFVDKEQRLDMALQTVEHSMKGMLQEREHSLALVAAKLPGLNPLAALAKGYSMSKVKDKVLTSVEQVRWGEEIVTSLKDGTIYSVVQEVVKNNGC